MAAFSFYYLVPQISQHLELVRLFSLFLFHPFLSSFACDKECSSLPLFLSSPSRFCTPFFFSLPTSSSMKGSPAIPPHVFSPELLFLFDAQWEENFFPRRIREDLHALSFFPAAPGMQPATLSSDGEIAGGKHSWDNASLPFPSGPSQKLSLKCGSLPSLLPAPHRQ